MGALLCNHTAALIFRFLNVSLNTRDTIIRTGDKSRRSLLITAVDFYLARADNGVRTENYTVCQRPYPSIKGPVADLLVRDFLLLITVYRECWICVDLLKPSPCVGRVIRINAVYRVSGIPEHNISFFFQTRRVFRSYTARWEILGQTYGLAAEGNNGNIESERIFRRKSL